MHAERTFPIIARTVIGQMLAGQRQCSDLRSLVLRVQALPTRATRHCDLVNKFPTIVMKSSNIISQVSPIAQSGANRWAR